MQFPDSRALLPPLLSLPLQLPLQVAVEREIVRHFTGNASLRCVLRHVPCA